MDGYVYFAISMQLNAIKIGYSANPEKRIKNVRYESDWVALLLKVPGGISEERRLHSILSGPLLRGEWFRITPHVMMVLRRIRKCGKVPKALSLERVVTYRRIAND